MLAAIGTGRIDSFESPTDALDAMAKNRPISSSPPPPCSRSAALVACMRLANAGKVTLVPAMMMSARAKPALVEEALEAGAHQVLVLATTASTLYRRLDWLINDDRPFELKGDRYVLSGMEERLSSAFSARPMFTHAPQPRLYGTVPAGRRAKKTRVLRIRRPGQSIPFGP